MNVPFIFRVAYIFLFSITANAAYVQYESDDEIVLRSKRRSSNVLEVAITLPPGSLLEVDRNKSVGSQRYRSDDGSVKRSTRRWFKNVRISGKSSGRFRNVTLYMSETYMPDLVAINGDDQGVDPTEPVPGKRGWRKVTIDSLVTLRERTGGRSGPLQKVIDVPSGSSLEVNFSDLQGRMDYLDDQGRMRRSSRGWFRGVRIVNFSGRLSRSRKRRINSKTLFVSEEILDFTGGKGGKGGASNPYPSLIKIRTRDKTKCLPKKLWGFLKAAAQKFRRPVHILSAHRSREDNSRRGGAKASLHISCRAADIKIPGVSGVKLASFLANLRGRGGVGFYCNNRIHIDVGRCRQWGGCAPKNFSCRR